MPKPKSAKGKNVVDYSIQRFSDGVKADPGDIPGVGGSIDVAVITRDKGFVWISKKKLKAGGNIVDLENVKDVS